MAQIASHRTTIPCAQGRGSIHACERSNGAYGSFLNDGRVKHFHARPEMVLIATAERTAASSSSAVVGNWNTMNSVRCVQEQVNVPSSAATVMQPLVDHSYLTESHHRHSTTLLHPASVRLLGRPTQVITPSPLTLLALIGEKGTLTLIG